ncbi:hypothetical protein [Halobacterium bonnevillei]|uniref:hypothetical protein n=1 Tax=Halobacterium bonnevillei TaxID=2692200 RepID=UPI00191698B0|nr:hypothetical protein [Halobacterium bonnevillei]
MQAVVVGRAELAVRLEPLPESVGVDGYRVVHARTVRARGQKSSGCGDRPGTSPPEHGDGIDTTAAPAR